MHNKLILFLLLASLARAANPDAPADFPISTTVAVPNPDRYGTNIAINGFADYNNGTYDAGFEPFNLRKLGVASGGGADYLVNSSASGPTTTVYDLLNDGFFDGAAIRVYRIVNNRTTLLRTGTVTQYIGGWNRVLSNRLTATTYKDGGLVSGKTYYYTVRAYDTSGNLSGNSNTQTIVALASNGTGDTISATFTPTVTDSTAPAAPTGLTAVANADGTVSLSWTANVEADMAGYYVYRAETDPSLHNRIYISGAGTAMAAGDFYFLELSPDNVPMEKLSPRVKSYFSGNDTWREIGGAFFPYNQPVSKLRDSSTVCPENGGRTSMKLTAPGPSSYEVSLRQTRYGAPDSYYGCLVPGRTYRMEVWLKQSGIASGAATFRMTNAYSAITHTWAGVAGSWQKFSFDFIAPAYPAANSGVVELVMAFNGPGSLWMDNLFIYDPAQPLFAFRPEAKQQMADFAPGWIRSHTGHTDATWGSSMEDWTNVDALAMNQFASGGGRARPEQPYHLPFMLQLAKDTGANPWLIVGSYMNEQEWLNFIEYLAGPAGTPYGDKRIAQRGGITTPWTDEFPRLRIEYGNEMWNPTFEWGFNGSNYGQFAEYFYHVAHQSPYFATFAGKVDFVADGQLVSTGTGGYSAAAMQVPPALGANANYCNFANLALYLGGWDAHVIIGNGLVNDAGFTQFLSFAPTYGKYWFDLQAQTRDQVSALTGRPYRLGNYESAPGYALPSPGAQFDPVSEAYGKSLAAGVSTLDSFLYGTYKRIDPQCYFTVQTGVNWASHGYLNNGNYPYPSWLALQMRNRHASGDMLATAINTAPTSSVPAWINSQSNTQIAPAVPNMPLVSTYAFRNSGKYTVFVLSRKLNETTPVTLRLPFTNFTTGVLYTLTGDPRARNDQGAYNIQEAQQAITGFSQNYSFTMPPGSVYAFEFNGATTAVETNPTCTITQAIDQADPTSVQSAAFSVHFSQPITGFTNSDVIVSGTAGATVASVSEIDPFSSTDFRVDVSGMTNSGTVTINIPANAVFNSSSLGNLAASLIDNTVQYNMTPFVAYDDFNLAPVSAPSPPFLNAVGTGAGFSASWQLTGFNAATYGDGYKLANAAPLSYLNLRRAGSYAAGGKDFAVAARMLDVDNTFAFFKTAGSSPSVIGRSGTTLWMSAMFRKDSADTNRLLLFTLPTTSNISIGGSNLGIGYSGEGTAALSNGIRYWSLQVRNATNNGFDVARSNIPVATGQTAFLVLKCGFGSTDRFDLFVNPFALGGAAPASPDATWTTTGATDINCLMLGYSGGTTGANQSSIDEIRFGTSYADVTPTFSASESWRLTYFSSPNSTGNADDAADPDGDGLSNLMEYALGTHPMNSASRALPPSTTTTVGPDSFLTLNVSKNPSATDVVYAVEVSPDLIHWFSGTTDTTVITDNSSSLVVRDNTPITVSPRRFIRLKVTH